jgi:hypothetical protein
MFTNKQLRTVVCTFRGYLARKPSLVKKGTPLSLASILTLGRSDVNQSIDEFGKGGIPALTE